MTTEQIILFVSRLLRNEVPYAELEALSANDLATINLHLYRTRHDPVRKPHAFAGPVTFGSFAVARAPEGGSATAAATTSTTTAAAPRRTFSEAEILAELGVSP
jgi:hypothetical protein